MHPESCLSFNLFLSLGTGMMVDIVMVDVFCALSAHKGPTGAHWHSDGPLIRTGDTRTGGPRPYQSLKPKARPRKRLLLWGSGARRATDYSRGLAARRLQDTRKVIVQDRLGIFIRRAR